MPQDHTTPADHYRRFIERVGETGQVWGLCRGEDWAFCESNEYEETDVLVFWSDRSAAQQHVQGEWSQHVPTVIPLDVFIEQWLAGMDEDGALVGPDWDADLNGLEVEPGEMAANLAGDEEE